MPDLPTGTVTFLFTDIEGSTALWERDRTAMRVAVERHLSILRTAIEANGGVLFKVVGDAVQAAFPTAPSAVAAAVDAQRALFADTWGETGPLRVRMALHAGEASPDPNGDYLAPALNRLARLLTAGNGGQVLLSQVVHGLVREALPSGASLRDLGEHRLRDLLEPERVFQVLHPDLPADFPALRSLASRPNNLPSQLTSLIGREADIAAIRSLVTQQQARLVTLTGPGGTGKTRLALAVAAELVDVFPDGIWFVDLAPLADPTLVLPTIAATLGVRETGALPLREALRAFVARKRLLLILDNFEHVLAGAQVVSDLLQAGSDIAVLVTSREPLRLLGERQVAVSPLRLPAMETAPTLEALGQVPAIALFVQRAQAAKADFVLTNDNAEAVTTICRRLDGLPLAIVLAAARANVLAPPAMLARLMKRLPLLTGGSRDQPARLQTMRQAIAWSYDLLSAEEQRLFRCLAVFVGGCTLAAAEGVVNAVDDSDIDVFEGVASLVDKSLLVPAGGPNDESRFGILETIREYGLERLEESGEAAVIRKRHAAFFLTVAEAAAAQLRGREQVAWLARLEAEHYNLRAALTWSLDTKPETGLALAGALHWFWFLRGHWAEGRRWLEEALALPVAARRSPARATALAGAGVLAYMLGDYAVARVRLEESTAIGRDLGNWVTVAFGLNFAGNMAYRQGDYAAARSLLEECVAIARAAGDRWDLAGCLCVLGMLVADPTDTASRALAEEGLTLYRAAGDTWGLANATNILGEIARADGDYERAAAFYEESLAGSRDLDDEGDIAIALVNLGFVALYHKDPRRGAECFAEAMPLFRLLGDQYSIAHCLAGLAGIADLLGQTVWAARLFGSAEVLLESTGAALAPLDRIEVDRGLAAIRAQLGETAFATAAQEGRALPLDQALAEAEAVAEAAAKGEAIVDLIPETASG